MAAVGVFVEKLEPITLEQLRTYDVAELENALTILLEDKARFEKNIVNLDFEKYLCVNSYPITSNVDTTALRSIESTMDSVSKSLDAVERDIEVISQYLETQRKCGPDIL